jgi:ribosomal protein S18 acetylase RimI-like enzyme
VYEAFYPQEWQVRQVADIERILDTESENVWVAVREVTVLGWVAIRLHPIDTMGEIHIIAVDPQYQRLGIGNALTRHAMDLMRRAGMKIVMVETGDDPGHASARRSYEKAGFERWPVARYFRRL